MILTTSRLPESAASLFRTLNKAYPEIHISNPYPVTERKGESGWCNVTETVTLRSGDVIWRYGTLVPKERDCGTSIVCMCVFITAVPITKLLAWGEGDSGGHVLRETTSRGLSAPITDPLFLIRNRSPDPLVQVAGRDHPFPIFAGSPGREGGIVSLNENCIYSLFSILSIRAGLSE